MYGLDVLQCIVYGGFGMYFVGFVVLGGVLSFFLPKDKARLGLALVALVMYGVQRAEPAMCGFCRLWRTP